MMDLDKDNLVEQGERMVNDPNIGIASEIIYPVQDFVDPEGNIYEMTLTLKSVKPIVLDELPEGFEESDGYYHTMDDAPQRDIDDVHGDVDDDEEEADL